ncbi:MAG: hypothetical protein AB1324_08245 [Candidatus Micrarchaeota archaeon]
MAMKQIIPAPVKKASAFLREAPSTEGSAKAMDERETAAFSDDAKERHRALSGLYDLDSLAFVSDNTPHPETRAAAQSALEWRMRSFTDEVASSVFARSDSQSIRECAEKIRRPG